MNALEFEDILCRVEKPGRYIGGEVNTHGKDVARCRCTVALAFPDAYEIGMSHTGLQILYAVLNGEEDIVAERVFAPWPDMEARLREGNIPLSSLESAIPLNRFDIVGFSLQYELSYTNVLAMLELGGIPIRTAGRGEDLPLVIAGGPGAFNPEPMAPFIDAFAIGEGEEVILDISRAVMEGKAKGYGRSALLAMLAEIEGVFVPTVHRHGEIIVKRVISDLDRWTIPEKPVVPLLKTIHDRVTLEIARGCTRGCRFCQAGMLWRPARERSPEALMSMAERMLRSTGWDELSLLSLSAGDYSLIEPLLASLMNRYCAQKIALALPSLRVETLTPPLIREIRRVRKTSFTLAPEAGTQRLRNIINKGNTEEDLIAAAGRVFEAGWRSIKLYFMIGLPRETPGDLQGIGELAHRVLRAVPMRGQLTVSLSTFIPKPHTPFQWHRQLPPGAVRDIQEYLKKTIRHRNLNLKWHDARMSLLEGLLSRGDRRISELIEGAYRRGCRFDGWSDEIRFDRWEETIESLGIKSEEYLGGRPLGGPLPWDYIDCGITRAHLLDEYEKAERGELTADCRSGTCHQCGACTPEHGIVLARDAMTASPAVVPEVAGTAAPPIHGAEPVRKYRMRFAKGGRARFLSHLDTSSAMVRAITRSGLSFAFSEGFHPHPRISFPHALPLGVASRDEYVDMDLAELPGTVTGTQAAINNGLPSGLEIFDIREVPRQSRSISNFIEGFSYEARLPGNGSLPGSADIPERIRRFLEGDTFLIARTKKDRTFERNIRPLVKRLTYDAPHAAFHMELFTGPEGGVRPSEILIHVIGLDDDTAKMTKVVKTGTILTGGAATYV